MKPILLLVFVFSLNILTLLAARIPQHAERRGPLSSDDSLSTDRQVTSSKGRFRRSTSGGRWRKVNSSPVCFGARNHQYGRFYMPFSGSLAAIGLVHLYGFVSCNTADPTNWSFWGCGGLRDWVNVVITNAANHIILPSSQFFVNNAKWSRYPSSYNAPFAPELALPVFSHPRPVSKNQEFRVWYGEDFTGQTVQDNGGRSCSDVYALYV